jgi:hypothetical protein
VPHGEVVPGVGTEFAYPYDFGDRWEHQLILQAILLRVATLKYPTCICGEDRTHPEGVGGITGFEECLAFAVQCRSVKFFSSRRTRLG